MRVRGISVASIFGGLGGELCGGMVSGEEEGEGGENMARVCVCVCWVE